MTLFPTEAVKRAASPARRSGLEIGWAAAKNIIGRLARRRRTPPAREGPVCEGLCELDDHTLKDIGLCRAGLTFFKHRECFHEMNELPQQTERGGQRD